MTTELTDFEQAESEKNDRPEPDNATVVFPETPVAAPCGFTDFTVATPEHWPAEMF
jgi:hypothetical protein